MNLNTTEKVATRLGISVQRVRQVVKELGIVPFTVGKAIILTDEQVRMIADRKTQRGPRKGRD